MLRKTFFHAGTFLVKCQNGWARWKSFKTLSDAISNGKHVLTRMASNESVTEEKSVYCILAQKFHANIECHFTRAKSIFMLKYLIWGRQFWTFFSIYSVKEDFFCSWNNIRSRSWRVFKLVKFYTFSKIYQKFKIKIFYNNKTSELIFPWAKWIIQKFRVLIFLIAFIRVNLSLI